MDYEERITAAELGQGEERSEMTLRPQKLEDYIGQKKATDNLKIFIEAAKLRKEPLDHVLFYGPPGLGKTTLAGIISNEMGVDIRICCVSRLHRPATITALVRMKRRRPSFPCFWAMSLRAFWTRLRQMQCTTQKSRCR